MNFELKNLDKSSFEEFFRILSQMSEWEDRGALSEDVKERLRLDYFGERRRYNAILAHVEGKVGGFIVFLETYATFDAKPVMWIEDLFLLEEYRGMGLGKELFSRALEIAQERGYSRVELLAFGEGPRKFYEKFGFECQEMNHHYRKFLV